MELLISLFLEATIQLFEFLLQLMYFVYNGEFYEHIACVAMWSPLPPGIADFFMVEFEQKALNQASLKPGLYRKYFDDTLLVWSHGQEALDRFMSYLNGLYESRQFTVEMERDAQLPFLYILIRR